MVATGGTHTNQGQLRVDVGQAEPRCAWDLWCGVVWCGVVVGVVETRRSGAEHKQH